MSLRINTNVPSLASQRALKVSMKAISDNLRKLSSGERITRASDDAAGLAISENLKAKIRGNRQAARNGNDAISMIQTTEAGLNEISSIIIRLRELAVQAASDTVGAPERRFSDIEFQQLKDEIDRIAKSAEFNGIPLLDGSSGIVEYQIGYNNDPILDRLRHDGTAADSSLASLGLSSEDVTSKEGARLSLGKLDDALVKVNGVRANLGAMQNRLSSLIRTLDIQEENLSAANSRIRDVDIASETADYAKNRILVQAGTSVLSQANQQPSFALKLLD